MPRIPHLSPATGKPTSPNFIHTLDGNFVDSTGRTVLFRGVNLSGSSKAPVGEPSYILNGFWEDAESGGKGFIGRPLNVDDGSADVHLARLRGWGFNVIRYPVTWEALEHEGPGKYDYEFMDYTIRVLRKCHEYGFKVYMDPHQDVWSRFSGGSGAPYWTLPACGINPRNFTATQSAVVHCEYPLAHEPDPASVPAMTWSTNYGRLATQTVFTLFFSGRDFAPKCVIDDQNIQDYLQSHYIEAFGQLADRITATAPELLDECIIGWDSMNEPSEGFAGYPDLNVLPTEQGSVLKKGPTPTPAQSLRLGMGQAQTVENWAFGTFGPHRDGSVTVDPQGLTIWSDPSTEPGGKHPVYGWTRDPCWELGKCIWSLHGVWDIETGYVMRPDYFKALPDPDDNNALRDVAFIADHWRPHWQDYARRIRVAHPEAIHFVAPPVFAQPPPLDEEDLGGRCCYSTHYYDGLTLVSRHWNWFNADALGLLRGKYKTMLQAVKIGERAIRKSIQEQLGILKEDAVILGPYPTIIGEIGIPYDMDSRAAYGHTDHGKHKGDYTNQERALDASLNAADGPNALHYTLWTYCPDNLHQWGDGWNMEDLSVWSVDDLRPRDGRDLYHGNLADKSSAMLLNGKVGRSRSTFAMPPSQLSLATLPVAAAILNEDPARREIQSSVRWESAYDFLTDGARAAKAFSRPYPVAVVGVPIDIQFDIGRTEFKLTVRVRAEDAPVAPATRPPTPSSIASSAEEQEKHRALATEVFLPVVHYASDRAVGGLLAQSAHAEDPSARTRASSSSETLDGHAVPPAVAPYPPPPRNSGSSSDTEVESEPPMSQPLAVEVHVSDGRWALEGTTLRWWYSVPTEGEPAKEVTMWVARRGGRIWTREEREKEGVWEKVCGGESGGCCIM